jgi:hypothetical protein
MREGEEKETQTFVHTGLCLHISMGGGRGAGHGCLCTQDCNCAYPWEAVKRVSMGVCAHKIVFAHTQGKWEGGGWCGEELRRSREGIHHVTYS